MNVWRFEGPFRPRLFCGDVMQAAVEVMKLSGEFKSEVLWRPATRDEIVDGLRALRGGKYLHAHA